MIEPHGTDTEGRVDQPDDDDGFVARWSRRKQAGYRAKEHPSAPGPQAVSAESVVVDDVQQDSPRSALTEEDLPPVDSLDEKSDYAAFLSPGVSEQLRASALHRLFHLPGLHVPDGLDDYDDDFTQFAKLGDIVPHEMQRMLLREREAADAKGAPQSQPVRLSADSEADLAQNAEADGVLDAAENSHGGDGAKPSESA